MPAIGAGVSLARLLWHVPVPAMVTLIASLLLERRVLVVGQSRDMVSAAVLAAQALIHPFRWAGGSAELSIRWSEQRMQGSAQRRHAADVVGRITVPKRLSSTY